MATSTTITFPLNGKDFQFRNNKGKIRFFVKNEQKRWIKATNEEGLLVALNKLIEVASVLGLTERKNNDSNQNGNENSCPAI